MHDFFLGQAQKKFITIERYDMKYVNVLNDSFMMNITTDL